MGESDMCLRHTILFVLQTAILFAVQIAICSSLTNVVESMLPINPHATQFVAYLGFAYLVCDEECKSISQAKLISQIREDLYRFSLSASSDKLNFRRVQYTGTNQKDTQHPYHIHIL